MRRLLPSSLLLAGALALLPGGGSHSAPLALSFGDRAIVEAAKKLQPSVVHT